MPGAIVEQGPGGTGSFFSMVSESQELYISHIYPIGSMYGIYANIWGILMVNVTIYSIHGSYGYGAYPLVNKHSYGKSPFFMGKSTINGHFQ